MIILMKTLVNFSGDCFWQIFQISNIMRSLTLSTYFVEEPNYKNNKVLENEIFYYVNVNFIAEESHKAWVFPLLLQICLLRLLWRSLKSHCSALHLHKILPQDWALSPSTIIPEYLELHTVVRSFRHRGKASLSFAELSLRDGARV